MPGLYWIISHGCHSEKTCFPLLVKKVATLGPFYFVLNNVPMSKIFGKLAIYPVDHITLQGKTSGCNADSRLHAKEIVHHYFGLVLVTN